MTIDGLDKLTEWFKNKMKVVYCKDCLYFRHSASSGDLLFGKCGKRPYQAGKRYIADNISGNDFWYCSSVRKWRWCRLYKSAVEREMGRRG